VSWDGRVHEGKDEDAPGSMCRAVWVHDAACSGFGELPVRIQEEPRQMEGLCGQRSRERRLKAAHSCSNMHNLKIYEHRTPNYIEIEYIFVIISIEFIFGV
jgi:hypothetical protein